MEWMESIECRELYKKIIDVLSKSSESRKKKMDRDSLQPIVGMWTELQRDNKLPKGVLTASCELELQDLMKQIDKLVAEKKGDWERQKDGLQSRLNIREKENLMMKSTLEQKHKEIGQLRVQYDNSEKKQRELVTQYESTLSKVHTELQNLKRDYERVQKRYVKQKKETEQVKERSVLEINDRTQEVDRLTKKCEDYRSRSKDWDIERRTQQKQIENLEAQRKALSDKCEFVQLQFDELEKHRQSLMDKCEIVKQQAQTYQNQLDKRREILDSTELSLNAQIAQLETKLNSTSDSLKAQNTKVDKLKASLDEAMKNHKKAMDDNERLLIDLKKANTQARKAEELNTVLKAELEARDGFLRMSEEDSQHHLQERAVLEQQIAEKDKVIKSLTDTKTLADNDEMNKLRAHFKDIQEQARLSQRNEEVLKAEHSQLEEEMSVTREDCRHLAKKLEQRDLLQDILKMRADVGRLEEELSSVKSQLVDAQTRLKSLNGSHEAELDGMRDKLNAVTIELDDKSSNVGALSEKSREMEEQLHSEMEECERQKAELKLANAQIDALRLENRHLRQTIIQQTQVNLEHTETETQLRELHETYQQSLKSLENENHSLREEMARTQQEISVIEDRFDAELQRTIHEAELSYTEELKKEDRRIMEIEEDSDRRVSMLQDRLDSTINRYEEQLQLLRKQKSRLEDDLDRERGNSSVFIRPGQVLYEDDDEVMYINDNMSLTEVGSGDELDGHGEENSESQEVRDSASEKFFIQEQQRARQLETIIDSHIEQLMSKADAVINRRLPEDASPTSSPPRASDKQ